MSKKKVSNNPYALTEAEHIVLETLQQIINTIILEHKQQQLLKQRQIQDNSRRIQQKRIQIVIYDIFGIDEYIGELKNLVKSTNQENLQGTKAMEEEIDVKVEEMAIIYKSIQEQQNNYEEKLYNYDKEKEREFKQFQNDKNKEIAEQKKRLEQLLQEKQSLLTYPEREKRYQETIAQQEQDQIELKKTHEEELQKYERNFIKQKRKMDDDQKQAILQIKKEALEEANKKLRDAEQTTKENIKLNQDLELHKNELQELQIEREQVTHQNNQYKRGLAQNHEGLVEYQTINHKQSVKIKKLKEKVQYLHEFLEKESKKIKEEFDSLQSTHQRTIAEMEYQVKCFNRQLIKRAKEIRDFKSISQMILDQRSDIEQFFLESLDYVKEQQQLRFSLVQRELQNESSRSYSSSTELKLPSLNSRSYKHSLVYKNKIDISQLNESDKQRILRMVFDKMNTGVRPKPWRQYYDYSTLNDNTQERDKENYYSVSISRNNRYDENQVKSYSDDSSLKQQQQYITANS